MQSVRLYENGTKMTLKWLALAGPFSAVSAPMYAQKVLAIVF